MMRIPFSPTAYDRNEYGLPSLILENWFPEVKPHLGQYRLLPTPGLTLFQAASTGVRGMFQADGILSGQLIYADGTSLERITSGGTNANIATVASDAYRAQFAASQADLVATSGGTAYVVTAGAATAITVGTSSGDITSVAELGQRHLFTEDGTGRFWWSAVGDPTTVSNTSFATAESEPDNLLSVQTYRGRVFLYGTQTVEPWVPTGDQDRAFVSVPGGVINRGLIGRDAITRADNAIFHVTPLGQVMMFRGGGMERISNEMIEGRIKDLSAANQALVKLSSYFWRGHEFIRITLPGEGSWNYDLATGSFHRAKSLGGETHIVDDYVEAFGSFYAGGAGGIYSLSRTTYTEAGEEVRRVAELLFPVQDATVTPGPMTIYTSTENVPVSGTGSAPQIMLRIAHDGVNLGSEMLRDLPLAGQYAQAVVWGQLGTFGPPVAKFQVAISDPIGVTLSDATFAQARPSR